MITFLVTSYAKLIISDAFSWTLINTLSLYSESSNTAITDEGWGLLCLFPALHYTTWCSQTQLWHWIHLTVLNCFSLWIFSIRKLTGIQSPHLVSLTCHFALSIDIGWKYEIQGAKFPLNNYIMYDKFIYIWAIVNYPLRVYCIMNYKIKGDEYSGGFYKYCVMFFFLLNYKITSHWRNNNGNWPISFNVLRKVYFQDSPNKEWIILPFEILWFNIWIGIKQSLV